MSYEKLKRVIWRLKEAKPDLKFSEAELRKSIMIEIGTDERTIKGNKKKLMELKWIKREVKHRYYITNHNEIF